MIKLVQSELYAVWKQDEGVLWGFGRHYISCGVVISWIAMFFKISQILQLKWMHIIVYNLYPNKTVLKSKENEQNIFNMYFTSINILGLPWWSRCSDCDFIAEGLGFNPWSGNQDLAWLVHGLAK